MNASVNLPKTSLQQVVEHVLASRQITRADQRSFMSVALSGCNLTSEEKKLLDSVFDALRQGRLRVVN